MKLSLANEYVGDVTIPTQVIKYNQIILQAEQPIRLQYSNQIILSLCMLKILICFCFHDFPLNCFDGVDFLGFHFIPLFFVTTIPSCTTMEC